VKVKNQPDGNVQQLHVTQELGLVDGQYLLHALEFQQQAKLQEKVEPQRLLKDQPFVLDLHFPLIHRGNAAKAQFPHQAALVDAFEQARPFDAMNLNGRANGFTAQFVSLCVKRMHGRLLQKVTKETKKNFSEGFFRSAGYPCGSKSYGAFEELHVLRLPHWPSIPFFHPSFPSVQLSSVPVCVRVYLCSSAVLTASIQKWVKLQINASSSPSRQKTALAAPYKTY
jgi:hypothetical protein